MQLKSLASKTLKEVVLDVDCSSIQVHLPFNIRVFSVLSTSAPLLSFSVGVIGPDLGEQKSLRRFSHLSWSGEGLAREWES
jgi:hypothetical protein